MVIDGLFFRGIEALALLLNSLPFPVLRGFSSPGLSTNGLGSLVVENQVRERNTLIRLCFPLVSVKLNTRASPCTAELFLDFSSPVAQGAGLAKHLPLLHPSWIVLCHRRLRDANLENQKGRQ